MHLFCNGHASLFLQLQLSALVTCVWLFLIMRNHFGFSSNKTPPTILELKPFEEDVLKLLENIKFRDTKNNFQETLANDLKKINLSDKIFVFADKTRNIYETWLDTYNKLLHDNITKTYKHGSELGQHFGNQQ